MENEEKVLTNDAQEITKKKGFKKYFRIAYEVLITILFLLFFFSAGSAQSNYESLKEKYEELQKELSTVKSEYSSYQEEMKPFEEMTAAQAEAAAAQKAAEEEAARLAEEAKGYETGITYNQLARTPDDFLGKKVKFYGKVLQVIEDGSTVQIRLAVNDDYDTVLLGEYDSSIVSSRVLEDDEITIYGTSIGTITYQSTMGGNITIPGITIDKIDQ